MQNTMTNLGASMGTALAGSVMIAAVATSFLANIQQNDAIPARAKEQAQVELAGGVAFVSDDDLEAALDEANVSDRTTEEALDAYRDARIDGLKTALAILAALVVGALFFAGRIPTTPPGAANPGPMCRWLAYSGSPIRLEELLVKRDRSLIDQSLHARQGATTTNGDGFGVGWYEEGGETPRLYEAPIPPGTTATSASSPPGSHRLSSSRTSAPRPGRRFRRRTRTRSATALAVDAQRADPRVPAGEAGARARRRRLAVHLARGHHGLRGDVLPRSHLRTGKRSGGGGRADGGPGRSGRASSRHRTPDPDAVATTDGRTVWAFRYSSEGDSRSLYFSTRMDSLKALYRGSKSSPGCRTRRESSSPSLSATCRVPGTRCPSLRSGSSSPAPTSSDRSRRGPE